MINIFKHGIFKSVASLFVLIVIFLVAGRYVYVAQSLGDLELLCSARNVNELYLRFGKPDEIFDGTQIQGRGWEIPHWPATGRVEVFVRMTGRKFFVEVDNDGQIQKVFASSS